MGLNLAEGQPKNSALKLEHFTEYNSDQWMAAILRGDIDPNMNIKGEPILIGALFNDDLDVARALIERGANVNVYSTKPADIPGITPIHAATTIAAVELLASAGAHIDAPYMGQDMASRMPGETRLHAVALSTKNSGLMAALLKAGANPDLSFGKEYKYSKNTITSRLDQINRGDFSLRERLEASGVSINLHSGKENVISSSAEKSSGNSVVDLDHSFASADGPIDLALAYDVVEAKMEDFEKVAIENVDASQKAIMFAKDRIHALENALAAEQAQRQINEAKLGMLESRIQTLEGVISLRDGKMSQAETLFEHSAKSVEKAKVKLENFAESIKSSPFIESVLEKINYSKSKLDQGVTAGKELKAAFIEDVERVASFMGRMAAAVKGIPASVKKAVAEKAISISAAAERTVRFTVNEINAAKTKTVNVAKAAHMTTASFVSGLARKAIAGIEAIANDFSENLNQIEAAAKEVKTQSDGFLPGGAASADVLYLADAIHSVHGGGISRQEIVSQLQNPSTMAQSVNLELQKLGERMDMSVAKGEDCVEGFDVIHKTLSRLLDESPWTMHNDHGHILRSEAEELDSQLQHAP